MYSKVWLFLIDYVRSLIIDTHYEDPVEKYAFHKELWHQQ